MWNCDNFEVFPWFPTSSAQATIAGRPGNLGSYIPLHLTFPSSPSPPRAHRRLCRGQRPEDGRCNLCLSRPRRPTYCLVQRSTSKRVRGIRQGRFSPSTSHASKAIPYGPISVCHSMCYQQSLRWRVSVWNTECGSYASNPPAVAFYCRSRDASGTSPPGTRRQGRVTPSTWTTRC